MKVLNIVALILVIIGGINWGLVGIFQFNLVDAIFGTLISRIIYIIVGLAALWALTFFPVLGGGRQLGSQPRA